MRASNLLVRKWLLENEYDEIWFKPHSKRNDLVFTQKGNYLATDLWNLFDGMCFKYGTLWFLQNKTNAWAKEKPIRDFIKRHPLNVLIFNVTDKLKECKGHYKVFVRMIN
uniref:ORF72 n=1 Tax=Nitrosopumilaceae spindle-shaped virus TaxID=3065433 RepID=A0AAT9JA81_9VIRU